jgi:glycosyltransferase involved in cell wall biosynthesis
MARRLRAAFVLEVRDLWPESLVAAGGSKGPAYHTLGAIARHLYRRSDRVIVLTRGVASHLEHRRVPREKLIYIPNGADTDAFIPHARPRGPFTLIYAGAHGPANGLDTVLDAAELLGDEPIRLLLVGDGPSKSELRAKAERRELNNVQFLDPVPKVEMPALLSRANAGLMVLRNAPLFSYGVSPNKLFDYLAAGLPVACNVPGEVATLLRQSGAGEQARDSSAHALADAIMRIAMRSPRERERMGTSGREWVAREHSRAVLGKRLDRALRDVMRTRS